VPARRRLLDPFIGDPPPDLDHAADLSWWDRRQAEARAAHYRPRG
jgi:hypothetical protein